MPETKEHDYVISDPDGSAYPFAVPELFHVWDIGLTKREHYIGCALKGFCARKDSYDISPHELARRAVILANSVCLLTQDDFSDVEE
jgi:hypothetical protein